MEDDQKNPNRTSNNKLIHFEYKKDLHPFQFSILLIVVVLLITLGTRFFARHYQEQHRFHLSVEELQKSPWTTILIKRGDNLFSLFKRAGISEEDYENYLSKKGSEDYMEVNKMLALVDEFFPIESGLYKKGAKFDEKITLLYFNFPAVASKYSQQIESFEKETNWKISVNDECNVSAAQDLIFKLVEKDLSPQNVRISKVSYFPIENCFKVKVSSDELISNEAVEIIMFATAAAFPIAAMVLL